MNKIKQLLFACLHICCASMSNTSGLSTLLLSDSKRISLDLCQTLTSGSGMTFSIQAETNFTFVAPNGAIKGQWMELVRAAIDTRKLISGLCTLIFV